MPISILKSFAAPGQAIVEDNDLLRERITTTATSLLTLVGIEADPVQSREHILLSTIMDYAWRQEEDLDLAKIIQQVQEPPVSKVGVLDIESFYPARDRFGLVMALNNLLASPGFNAWLEGEALDIGQILYTKRGKPRVAIFNIAHLSDPERMFFVPLLLNQVLGWMRSQPGTSSLRAIVYMDEVFGYFPPLSNPPSKLPMLTLLKQARAYGVGMVLSTQNPVDLDYKGLSNAGTWFIGRLQTERDKMRLLDGLEGASVAAQAGFNRQELERTISALGKRVFLMNNINDTVPDLFQTRFAMSYLPGPLTRDQIKDADGSLQGRGRADVDRREPAKAEPAAPSPGVAAAWLRERRRRCRQTCRAFISRSAAGRRAAAAWSTRPGSWARPRCALPTPRRRIHFAKPGVWLTPITDEAIPVDWEKAEAVDLAVSDLGKEPEEEARLRRPAGGGHPGAELCGLDAGPDRLAVCHPGAGAVHEPQPEGGVAAGRGGARFSHPAAAVGARGA